MNSPTPNTGLTDCYAGVLLGTAVGDALGLPAEGLSRVAIKKRWSGRWRHRLVFGRGMMSDDTEHTLFVAQALLTYPDDPAAFQRCLAWKLRLWLLGAPAGIGLATLRAILKLWVGFPPNQSGVASAGNGPAMRSAIIGAYFADDSEKRSAFVAASTRLTHTDPRAEAAALVVAEAAAWAVKHNEPAAEWLKRLPDFGREAQWQAMCRKMEVMLEQQAPVTDYAASFGGGRGVPGYCYATVLVAIYAVLRHPGDFRRALESALDCGGDTDTVGAIVGAIMGAKVGEAGIDPELVAGIWEWPRSVSVLVKVAARLAEQRRAGQALGPVTYFWPGLVLRNTFFIVVVLVHGFRRLW